MPQVSQFSGIVIAIYHSDHPPPHFHVLHAEYEAQVAIDPVELLEGNLPRSVWRMVREWATSRRAELRRAWEQAQRHGRVDRIAPP